MKKTKEKFEIKGPWITLHNYIIGDLYFWIKHDLIVTNKNTNDVATVKFKPKGWSSKNDYQISGTIVNSNKTVLYNISGKWDSHLSIADPKIQIEVLIAKKDEGIQNFREQYCFSEFALNSNNLSVDLARTLPPTDSRFRPDMRALEFGNIDIATFEKHRLEKSQRERRKKNFIHKPVWFSCEIHKNLYKCEYLGEYFKTKDTGAWPKDLPDLFNS